MTINEWHNWYVHQAGWTERTRNYLISQMNLTAGMKILDVGCGTGALRKEFDQYNWFGIDIDFEALKFDKKNNESQNLAGANGLSLPFPNKNFDLVYAHFLLLWIKKPEQLIQEMARVTKNGGYVTFFGEPDHNGRIDYPRHNELIGRDQTNSLLTQGADITAGRRLGELLVTAKLNDVRFGVIGGEWFADQKTDILENSVLKSDLSFLSKNKNIDGYLRNNGAFIYIPTFYASGKRI